MSKAIAMSDFIKLVVTRIAVCVKISVIISKKRFGHITRSIATGERVLIELGSFRAESFEQLFDGVMNLPLENFIGREDAFPVKGHALNSKLHSIPDCQKIIKKACVKRLEKAYGISYFEETAAKHQIQFAIHKDIATIYLDTSGVGLHKRGYRRNSNDAPIKETLAAGIVDLARVRADSVVVDRSRRIKLKGLEADAYYYEENEPDKKISGAALMNAGINIAKMWNGDGLYGDFCSKILHFIKV